MPTPDEVRTQLVDILVTVQGCGADDVTLPARLKEDLGVDSITIVEVGEELGRRFDLYLADDTIDGMTTVASAIDAVVHHDGAAAEGSSPPTPAKLVAPPVEAESVAPPATAAPLRREDHDARRGAAGRLAVWMTLTGAALGVVVGLGGSAFISATGLGAADLPPLSVTTTAAPTATATTTPAPTPTGGATVPDPTLRVSSNNVSPGERFRLEGAFPTLDSGATLQVQVKDPGGDWDDFPITTKTTGDGKYKTTIYTSRTGKREFRMLHKASSKASPVVTVEIG